VMLLRRVMSAAPSPPPFKFQIVGGGASADVSMVHFIES
jgi:hypothetical protein